ncbi:hypothetical protein EVB37_052 [Rhizobium phage RHph_TM3_3_3]|nr:hypothetical protein EVB37_052 [Rhizobium phage RHph_TM3_3_3]
MTFVKAHERRAPAKSAEYIATHMALMTRTEQRIAFARRHGVELVDTDDPRLSAQPPEPAHSSGRKPLVEIAGQLLALAKSIGRAS